MSLLNGAGAPSSGLGTTDDFYIDTTNDRLYGPKTTTWGSYITLGATTTVVSSKAKTQRINLRRDTFINWNNENPVLSLGEPGFVYDTGELKVGDGRTDFRNLSAIVGSGSSGGGFNLEGGVPSSNYGAALGVDGGIPSSNFTNAQSIDGGTP